jgi:O-antigen/teichoic acid export membrane protein
LARHPEDLRQWVEGGMFWSLVASISVAGLLTLGTQVFDGSHQLVDVVFLASIALILDVLARLLFCVTWSWECMELEAAATVFQEGAFIALTFGAVHAGAGVAGVMLAYLASRGLGAAAGWAMICYRGRILLLPRPHSGAWRPILRQTIPFALDDGLSLSYIRIDTVLLGIFKGTTAVGLYQAGTNLVLYANVFARTMNLSLYARMSKAWPGDPKRLAMLRDASLHMLGAIAMPVTVGSLLIAPRLIPAIYGPEFAPAVFCYQLLVLVIPIRMLGHTLGTAITAANGQTRRTVAVAGAAVFNLLLNLYFIPRWSYVGAAETTFITESALYVTYAIMLRRLVGPSRAGHAVALPGLACVPLGLAVLLLGSAPLLVTIVGGALGYCVGLLLVMLFVLPRETWHRPRLAVAEFIGASAGGGR